MKKKITALFLCVALAAIAIVGASLAYFTDTDNRNQHIHRRRRKIDLIEQQSNEDHTGFVPYTGDKVLMPIVGSAQGEKIPQRPAHGCELHRQGRNDSRIPASLPLGFVLTMRFPPIWMTAMRPSTPVRTSCTATSATRSLTACLHHLRCGVELDA